MQNNVPLIQKFTKAKEKIEKLPPLKRHFLLAGLGAAAILPGVFSFKLVSVAVVLAGAAGMLASEFDRNEGGGNKNTASAIAGALFMGLALSPFADVPDREAHMAPTDHKPAITQPGPAAHYTPPPVIVR